MIAVLAVVSRSKMPMIRTRLVSLKKAMKVLTSGGMTWRIACGRMIRPCLLPVGQAERIGGLILPARHRLQAAADDFGKIGAREQDDGDLRAQQLVDVDAVGHEQRKHHARHEQQADQRHAADQLDIEHAERTDRRQLRAPAERDEDSEREAEGETEGREDQRHRQAAPAVLRHEGQAENAAPHQHADQRQRADPDQASSLRHRAAAGGDDRTAR